MTHPFFGNRWLFLLMSTAALLSALGVWTLAALTEEWSALASEPFGISQIRARIGLGLPALHLLYLVPALALAWIASRVAPVLLSRPWLLATVGLILLALPLTVGLQFNGAWRLVAVGDSMRWYPGPWALLALVPLQVHLADTWRLTNQRRYVAGHLLVTVLGLTFYAAQPDKHLFWLLATAAAATLLLSRPAKGLAAVVFLFLLIPVIWLIFDPLYWGELLNRVMFLHDASCAYAQCGWEWRWRIWEQTQWFGPGTLEASDWAWLGLDLAQGFILTGVAQLFGRGLAWIVIVLLLLHVLALFRLAAPAQGTPADSNRQTIRIYALLVLATILMTTAASMGRGESALALPWISYGINMTLVFAFIGGSTAGIAHERDVP